MGAIQTVVGGAILALILYVTTIPIYPESAPPVEVPPVASDLWLEPLNSPVIEGDDLIVRSHRKKYRADCPVVSRRHVIDEDGGRHSIGTVAWEGGPATTDFVDLKFGTSGLAPGGYNGFADVTYVCPGGYIFKLENLPFRFRVKALVDPAYKINSNND